MGVLLKLINTRILNTPYNKAHYFNLHKQFGINLKNYYSSEAPKQILIAHPQINCENDANENVIGSYNELFFAFIFMNE